MRVRFRRGLARRVAAPHMIGWSRVGPAVRRCSKPPGAPDTRQSVRGAGRLVWRRERSLGGNQALGGMTVAMPLMTTSPFWLVQMVSSLTMFFSATISLTVAVAVTVSPMRTGLVNLSSWPR